MPGLRYSSCSGKFDLLPDFTTLTPERTGIAGLIRLKEVQEPRPDYFALRFEGLLKVARDGLYRIVIVSDDGSRLSLHGQTLIDHDGNHPPKPAGRLVRLKQGLHPLVVEYFQGTGAKDLRVFLERCESRETMSLQEPREITEAELLHSPDKPGTRVKLISSAATTLTCTPPSDDAGRPHTCFRRSSTDNLPV